MLGVFVIIAMAGNILPAALFPEQHLMFGSIAVLLVVYFYGLGWGVGTALLASLHTIAIWHQPFYGIILMSEALVVALLLRRGINLFAAAAYFWLVISMPLYGLFYYLLMKMSLEAAGLLLLKQAANGLFNAAMAVILLHFLPLLSRGHKDHPTLWDSWLNIILLAFVIPPVLIMIFNSRPVLQLLSPSYETQLLAQSQTMEIKLPLQLALDLPASIHQASLYNQYLKSLALMMVPALLALLVAWVFSRRLTGPLTQLAAVTRNLANKRFDGQEISWPQKAGREVSELIANFQGLWQALDQEEGHLQQLLEEISNTEQEAQQAIEDAQAQNRWERFSTGRKLRNEQDQSQQLKELFRELETAEAKYRFLVEKSMVGVYILREERLIYVNPRFAEILGYPDEKDLQGVNIKDLVIKEDWLLVRSNLLKQLRNEAKYLKYQYQARCRDDSVRHVEVLDGISTYDGHQVIIGTLLDITERVEAENTIKHMAFHDPLTGLPNRLLFQDRIQQAFSFAERHQGMVGLLFIDLDHFKAVNDSLGHMVGDQLLKEVTGRLEKVLRTCDTISRFGGDEFNVLITEVDNESDVQSVAHKILRSMDVPFILGVQEIFVTCSIGISIYPKDCEDAECLLKNADTALYRAKDLGRNNFQTYDLAMGSRVMERMAMESSLRHVLERHELRVFYQPQVDLTTGRIIGVEALVRWNHPDGKIVPPLSFIPLAEELGLIIPIGEWILRTACLQAKGWQDEALTPIRMGINVSASQFAMPNFIALVASIIDEVGIDSKWINLEITESMLVNDAVEANFKFNELHDVGLTIAIDDFGTGYSSLGYLKDFPIDQLKLDRSFIRNLPHNKNDAKMAKNIMKMAHDLKMAVIAEGVENQEQYDFLRDLGCDEIQGYLISKPVPAEEVVLLFQKTYL
jgi:diguanylate cyclase (GGDEF)-like protein/PAS domain S-box-containing protein